MNGLRAAVAGGGQNLVGAQIAVAGGGGADVIGGIGLGHMGAVAVCLRMDGDGGDAQIPAAVENAAGDFTAIGNKDLAERWLHLPVPFLNVR